VDICHRLGTYFLAWRSVRAGGRLLRTRSAKAGGGGALSDCKSDFICGAGYTRGVLAGATRMAGRRNRRRRMSG